MGEIIDKLYLELGHVTSGKSGREINLEAAIRAALKISDLWVPPGGENLYVDKYKDLEALRQMQETFKALVE